MGVFVWLFQGAIFKMGVFVWLYSATCLSWDISPTNKPHP